MNTIQSLCIPRIEARITKEYITKVFTSLKIGRIDQINEIPLRNDTKHKRIIIKIKWNQSENTDIILSRLNKNETIKIVHDWPWYWRVVSTNPQI
jgi:hypothetical protein